MNEVEPQPDKAPQKSLADRLAESLEERVESTRKKLAANQAKLPPPPTPTVEPDSQVPQATPEPPTPLPPARSAPEPAEGSAATLPLNQFIRQRQQTGRKTGAKAPELEAPPSPASLGRPLPRVTEQASPASSAPPEPIRAPRVASPFSTSAHAVESAAPPQPPAAPEAAPSLERLSAVEFLELLGEAWGNPLHCVLGDAAKENSHVQTKTTAKELDVSALQERYRRSETTGISLSVVIDSVEYGATLLMPKATAASLIDLSIGENGRTRSLDFSELHVQVAEEWAQTTLVDLLKSTKLTVTVMVNEHESKADTGVDLIPSSGVELALAVAVDDPRPESDAYLPNSTIHFLFPPATAEALLGAMKPDQEVQRDLRAVDIGIPLLEAAWLRAMLGYPDVGNAITVERIAGAADPKASFEEVRVYLQQLEWFQARLVNEFKSLDDVIRRLHTGIDRQPLLLQRQSIAATYQELFGTVISGWREL